MSTDPRTGARRQLVAIGALFLIAPLAAMLLFFVFPQWIPRHTTNHGELLQPARALPDLALSDAAGAASPAHPFGDHWNLVLLGQGPCDSRCQAQVLLLRNLREVLRSDRPRVVVWYVTTDAADAAALAPVFAKGALHSVNLRVDHGAPGHRLCDLLAPAAPGAVYIVDPLGNWVMRYAPGAPTLAIYEDVKRLLRVSQIG